eukprot:TRINITY_DN161_c0_g1_i3.p1 TRINITY_DN161_c0_g1~~TRINITY_DN161_c0_g1_i3.p1  ORF type:complete len:625 (-),score=210.16 TRINITY_DN161_c0_g1_i3:211-2085(-)
MASGSETVLRKERKIINEKLEDDEDDQIEWMQPTQPPFYGSNSNNGGLLIAPDDDDVAFASALSASSPAAIRLEECPICQEKFPALDIEQHVVACLEAAEAKQRQEQEDFDLLVATEMAEKEEDFQHIDRLDVRQPQQPQPYPQPYPQPQMLPPTVINNSGEYPINQQPVKRVTAGQWLMQHLPPVFQSANTVNVANAGLQADTDLKRKLRKFPATAIEDKSDLVLSHLNASLTNEYHPLGRLVVDFTSELERAAKDEFALLSDLVRKVINFQKDLFALTHLHYQQIDIELSMISSQSMQTIIEECLFDRIYPTLFSLYKKQFKEKDDLYMSQAANFITLSPPHLGVERKYWMPNPMVDTNSFLLVKTPQEEAEENKHLSLPPFSLSINILKQAEGLKSPTKKLKCLSDAVNQVSRCALAYASTWGGGSSAGERVPTDDVIALTAYMIIKSKVNHLYCTKMYCDDFLSEDEKMGISGYFLCSLQTALDFICQLDPETLFMNGEAAVEIISKHKERDPPLGNSSSSSSSSSGNSSSSSSTLPMLLPTPPLSSPPTAFVADFSQLEAQTNNSSEQNSSASASSISSGPPLIIFPSPPPSPSTKHVSNTPPTSVDETNPQQVPIVPR